MTTQHTIVRSLIGSALLALSVAATGTTLERSQDRTHETKAGQEAKAVKEAIKTDRRGHLLGPDKLGVRNGNTATIPVKAPTPGPGPRPENMRGQGN